MHWVLQENTFSEHGWDTLLATLERHQISHSLHKVVPFVGDLIPAPEPSLAITSQVICMGSYSMRHAARKYGWSPGVFDLEPQDFRRQLLYWGEHMLNAGSWVGPFRDAVFPPDEEYAFVRPTTDSKCFAGKVMTREEFEPWQRLVVALELKDGSSLIPETEVQVSKALVIHAEYRYWVVKGQIVTKSLYKRGTRVYYSPEVDERVDAYVRDRVGEWEPHQAFVIDVCDTAEGLKVVEINTLNAAGFYAGDVQKLVLALEEASFT